MNNRYLIYASLAILGIGYGASQLLGPPDRRDAVARTDAEAKPPQPESVSERPSRPDPWTRGNSEPARGRIATADRSERYEEPWGAWVAEQPSSSMMADYFDGVESVDPPQVVTEGSVAFNYFSGEPEPLDAPVQEQPSSSAMVDYFNGMDTSGDGFISEQPSSPLMADYFSNR